MTDALTASILQDLTNFGWWLCDQLWFFPLYFFVPYLIVQRSKKPIARWRYVVRCLLINTFVCGLIERLVYALVTGENEEFASHGAIWTIWAIIIGVRKLRRKNLLKTTDKVGRRLGEDGGAGSECNTPANLHDEELAQLEETDLRDYVGKHEVCENFDTNISNKDIEFGAQKKYKKYIIALSVCLAVAIAAAVYLPKLSYDYGYSKAHEEASNNNSNQEEELSAAYIRLLYDAYEATSGNGSGLEEHKDVIQGYSVGYGDGWETAYRQGFEKALTWDKTLYDMNEYLNQSIEEDRPI